MDGVAGLVPGAAGEVPRGGVAGVVRGAVRGAGRAAPGVETVMPAGTVVGRM
jgi:hypothetical protein